MSWRSRAEQRTTDDDGRPLLEAVLEHYGVDLQHRSKQMVSCPLHEDNHPSLSVNTDKQLWKCQSCGKGGDSWELIKIMEGVDFGGARDRATALGLTDGESGGGDGELPGQSAPRWGSGSVLATKGNRGGNGAYLPSWRRR